MLANETEPHTEDLILCSATVRPYNAYFCALQTADTMDVAAAQQ